MTRYQIADEIGKGGMGVVFLAEDTTLGRKVALKFLGDSFDQHSKARERLIREARIAAAIEHPFICSIYEIDELDGKTFIAMEYVEGQTLKDRLDEGPLSPDKALSIAVEFAEAISTAHNSGIVHRDLKPSNVMLTRDGHVKVMDFGLAKQLEHPSHDSTIEQLTRSGDIPGSPAYMSPEQLRGQPLDGRSDLFSFGIVLCEMFAGAHPFQNDSLADVCRSILDEPPNIEFRSSLPIALRLRRLLNRVLAKNPKERPQSAVDVLQELQQLKSELHVMESAHFLQRILRTLRRPQFLALAATTLCLLAWLAYWAYDLNAKTNWAVNAIPEIKRLADRQEYREAYSLAERVKRYLPDHPELVALWPIVSHELSVTSDPAGADVVVKVYAELSDNWISIGKTPISDYRVSNTFHRLRLSKDGYQTLEVMAHSLARVTLVETGDARQDMVFVGARRNWGLRHLTGLDDDVKANIKEFLIDKFEVTNAQYAKFVASGGYRERSFWQHKFVKDGRELSWEQAMSEFRDKTGRAGPADWELGQYPAGRRDFPVSGVSWYEAAAYAEFVNKQLPTVFHWSWAVRGDLPLIFLSNIGNLQGAGPARVGQFQGVSINGLYDVAGNVKEWCFNATDEGESRRYILGGAWNERVYMSHDPDAQSPFDRQPEYGFRCVISLGDTPDPRTMAHIVPPNRDYSTEQPISQAEFNLVTRSFAYDKENLGAKIVSVDESSEHWIKQKVVMNAAYGGEELTVYVFIPKGVSPPYQPIVYFPTSSSISGRVRSSETLYVPDFDFIIRSGRALCFPIYKSTYERGDGLQTDRPNMSHAYREHVVFWCKDLSVSIDYLKTRNDMDVARVGYYGVSWGAAMCAILPALEKRIKACVLHGGGFWQQRALPAAEQLNFAPRVTVPVLMLNGDYDGSFPLETSQEPMFRHLGTPEEDKKHITYPTGHMVKGFEPIKETLDWFDRYLGPVDMGRK